MPSLGVLVLPQPRTSPRFKLHDFAHFILRVHGSDEEDEDWEEYAQASAARRRRGPSHSSDDSGV